MIWLWSARTTWALLPVTTGNAFADATNAWSPAPARVAAALLWAAWAAGLVALFAPRPWSLTLLRVVAPYGFVCTVAAAAASPPGAALLAVACGAVALVLACSAPVAFAAANARAYGDERRFPLRIPTPLLLGPLPLAVVLAGAGVTAGPLLLAAGRPLAGAPLTVLGVAVAAVVARAVHPLSCRWFVLVPAGIAIADPLTLTEPVLVRREHVRALRRTQATALPAGALDLRMGTLAGAVAVELAEPVEFGRRRGRRDAEIVEPAMVAVAVVRAGDALALARTRRIAA